MPLGVVRCARELSDMIKAQLAGKPRATASKGRTRILSVAAGPAQELYELLTEQEFDQEIYILEHHLDRQLIYRTREEMLSFGRAGAPNCDVRIIEERTRINPFLGITVKGSSSKN